MRFDDSGLLARPTPSGNIPAWLDIPDPKSFRPKRRYRTVWISDVHLGTRGCNAAMLVDFLLGRDGRGVDGDLPAPAGALDEDLGRAIRKALTLDRKVAHRLGARFSWAVATDQFLEAIMPALPMEPAIREQELA